MSGIRGGIARGVLSSAARRVVANVSRHDSETSQEFIHGEIPCPTASGSRGVRTRTRNGQTAGYGPGGEASRHSRSREGKQRAAGP